MIKIGYNNAVEQVRWGCPKVVVSIPCLNVEHHIAEVVTKACKYADQVVVVDDGSCDHTAEVARVAGALTISHEANGGAGKATKSCFEMAIENGADILITLDGDGQHNPDEIPQILTPVVIEGANIVIGSRFINRQSNIPIYRKFGIKVITFLFNIGSRIKVSDSQSCFRAYSKKALQSLNITERGYAFSIQLLIQARRSSLAIAEVPVSCIYHPGSHSINPVVHGVGVTLAVIKLRLLNRC